MPRGAKDAKPAKAKVDAKLAVLRKSLKDEDSRNRQLEKRLTEAQEQQAATAEALQTRDRELSEAQEQQTATSEILQVISGSLTDIQPVLEAIAAKALDLCKAWTSTVFRFDGELVHLAAHHSLSPEAVESLRQTYPMAPSRGGAAARAVLSRSIVYISDIREDPEYRLQAVAEAAGYLSVLAVPMLRKGQPIGAVAVSGAQVGAFSQTQIALLETFAAQAVIAIENVRLFTELGARNRELTESLEQQTATGEVLQVISGSPTDVQPVFDTILDNATRLCEAHRGGLFLFDGDAYHAAAFRGAASALVEYHTRAPIRPGPHTALARVLRELRPVHIDDVFADAAFAEGDPLRRAVVELEGMRTLLMVPLLKEGRLVGALSVYRREVRPFADRQIGLLQTFADQAVIAIENVRLFQELDRRNRDLSEALEQQTATAEILRVISSSPTDIQPTFEAIAASAVRLCEANEGEVYRFDGRLIHMMAYHGGGSGAREALAQIFPTPPSRGTITGRAILTGTVVHADIATDPEHEYRDIGGFFRTVLSVPMLRDGAPIGAISVSRREGRPFSAKQIALLETFADQAVIAIENVRLFNETNEALEQQTATVRSSGSSRARRPICSR